MNATWKTKLKSLLLSTYKPKQAELTFEKYQKAFPLSYCDDYSPEIALEDIQQIETLSDENPIAINLKQKKDRTEKNIHIRLYQYGKSTPLSDILPIFENFDLRTFSGRPYEIHLDDANIWLSDFTVEYNRSIALPLDKIKPLFQDTFRQICAGVCENDGFNKLILGAELAWHEVMILRAYSKYLHQTRFRFSQQYIEKTVASYPNIARDLVELFIFKHDPKVKKSQDVIAAYEARIQKALESITSLDDDRIMRRFLALINATLRTNYFQRVNGQLKEYISIKLKSKDVPELPLPHPLYEIFVYSPRFEAVHLRAAKVARGGIRWSDRREDFRTEVLGLMKAQKVKNAVIVPSGAKGGFVLKALPANATREETQTEVVYCYKSFIRGLLDITDNLKNAKVIRPKDVYCYDDEDTYLVVAADKGTASFSDIANGISNEYDFWLGDAFASGGSAGYDHKKMGITARGAWESIKRHFRELNVDFEKTEFTVMGVGDMSGDVFGNGMLYTDRIQLIAAFDYRNIFIDPTPDTKKSFKERERLFNLPNSSWEDYNTKLLSAGGGVFKRSAKSIKLTAQMKKCLAVEDAELTPNELIRAILKAPVELFYNGGIGTYVKASTESHADVGDKTNEFCRINGNELRCRIVGEGGNLGFTQLGRVEYALLGGLINTDFIDNSAGVDCSDHEVNIKILLYKAIHEGKLEEKKRNALLAKMTDEIAKLVLKDNYDQALAMSFSSLRAKNYVGLHQAYLKELESLGVVNRAVEYLPTDKVIIDRKTSGLGLTRPEIAVLLAYSKIYIEAEILKSDLPEEAFFKHMIETGFPAMLQKSYRDVMQEHPLRRELIATHLSNDIVNEMGITFVYRVQTETGATVAEIIRAHTISSQIFASVNLEKLIDSLGAKIPIHLQYELLHYVRTLLNLSTRWFLRNHYLNKDIGKTVAHFSECIKKIKEIVPKLMVGNTKMYLDTLADGFIKAGLTKELAHDIAVYRALYTALNVIEVSTRYRLDLIKTAEVYFGVGAHFNLVWFRDQISLDSREGHWNSMARLTLRDELDYLQKMITITIMKNTKLEKNAFIEQWMKKHKRAMERWERLLQLLNENTIVDYTMFFVALRELADLVQASAAADGVVVDLT